MKAGFIDEKCKPLIGVVHLPPLPGSYGYKRLPYPTSHGRIWGFDEILDYAIAEAKTYEEAGFDAVILENYGDKPYRVRVGPAQVAAMTRIASEVISKLGIPVGISMLRNSGYEALSVAYASGASFVRVNSICEHRLAPEGYLEPAIHDIASAVRDLDLYEDLREGRILILGDIDVKHSLPLASRYDARIVVEDCLRRTGFQVHGVILTGQATGAEPEIAYVDEIGGAARAQGLRVIIGSGVSLDNIANYWRLADAFIVGTSVKLGGDTENRVSLERARQLVRLVEHYRRTWPCRRP